MTKKIANKHLALAGSLPYIILFIVPGLLYIKTVGYEFIPSWDDADYIIRNSFIRGVTVNNIQGVFREIFVANYAPIHILSYMCDYSIWKLNPAGYHLTNVILHVANALLLYVFMKRVTGRPGAAFAAALIFSVHPLNVENVAWVTERKTLLTTLFSLLSLLAYLEFRSKGGAKRFVLSLALYALAVLSKPLAVVLPLVVTAYDYFIGKELNFKRQLPFYALSVVLTVLAIWVHLNAGGVDKGNLSPAILFGTVYPSMLPIFWKYIGLIIFPFNLSGYYDTEIYTSWFSPRVLISLLGWIAIFIGIFSKGSRQVKFWFLWFWIWLLPVSNIVPLQVYYADRYMYMPAAGLFLLLTFALDRASAGAFGLSSLGRSEGVGSKGWIPFNIPVTVVWGLVVIVTIYFAAIAYERTSVWRDEIVFWEDTVRKSPGQDRVHLNLGYAYEMRGRLVEAEKEYLAAVNIYPSPEAVSNLKMVRAKSVYLRSRGELPK